MIALGRIASLFLYQPFPNLQFSPICLVLKHEPKSVRLNHHPKGGSVNNFTDRAWCQIHDASLDKALSMTVSVGRGAWLARLISSLSFGFSQFLQMNF